VPHSDNEGSSPGFDCPLVVGMAATMGRVSDSSISVNRVSPISLETGIVNLDAGRSMRGWGRTSTWSLEFAIGGVQMHPSNRFIDSFIGDGKLGRFVTTRG